jgi:hypothetical protein
MNTNYYTPMNTFVLQGRNLVSGVVNGMEADVLHENGMERGRPENGMEPALQGNGMERTPIHKKISA